jgi:hypothetical protein
MRGLLLATILVTTLCGCDVNPFASGSSKKGACTYGPALHGGPSDLSACINGVYKDECIDPDNYNGSWSSGSC